MSRRPRLSFLLLLAAGCQYVTGLEDLEIVANSQGAGPQGGAASGAGGTAGDAPLGAGGSGGDGTGGSGGDAGSVGVGGSGGTAVATTLIENLPAPTQMLALAQNDDALFFSATDPGPGSGRIYRWAKDGSGAAVVIRPMEDNPQNLWATATHIYWSTGMPPSELVRAPLGNPTTTEPVASGNDIRDFEIDALEAAFYADSTGVHVVGGSTIFTGSAGRFDARDGQSIFMLASNIVGFAKDGSGSVDSILNGGGKGGYVALSIDAAAVFGVGSSGLVGRANKDGTAEDADLATLLATASDIAVDELDDQIYVATSSGILRLPKTGGPITNLASASAASRLLIDADAIYWFDVIDADVWRTTR